MQDKEEEEEGSPQMVAQVYAGKILNTECAHCPCFMPPNKESTPKFYALFLLNQDWFCPVHNYTYLYHSYTYHVLTSHGVFKNDCSISFSKSAIIYMQGQRGAVVLGTSGGR